MINFDLIFAPARELIDGNKLLNFAQSGDALPGHWHVLSDLRQAQHLAWHADDDLIEVWTDLREVHAANLPDVEGAYEYWSDHYYELLESYLAAKGLEALVSDVEADLFHGCLNMGGGDQDRLWSEIMRAYQNGVWPCGWGKEVFPGGVLVVYGQ